MSYGCFNDTAISLDTRSTIEDDSGMATSTLAQIFALTAEQATELEQLILGYIRDAYAHRYGAEPTITLAQLSEYVGQHGRCPEQVRDVPRRRYWAIQCAVRRLLHAGRIEASLTEVRGREVRAYNLVQS